MKNYFITVLCLIMGSSLFNPGYSQNFQNVNKQTVIDNNTHNKGEQTPIVFIKHELLPYYPNMHSSHKKSIQNINQEKEKIDNEKVIEIHHSLIPYEERQAYYQEKKMSPFKNQNEIINLSPQPLKPYYPKSKE